ncbi:nucleoid-associated protein [Cronobacter turicensis]|uniref:nucleoid-associated protein n=1 Tax=Cronobacter turicensis TaxID=413502 RepID=UPI001411E57F|nr:nucleoid-associated protein [Cronobacter turicensis]NHV08060.1 nucleoid-associated protein [Cronobacter turicensis]NHV63054.1 nucleoid-associated protein [Cronobacter turicensis]NHW09995.1 nucleoid-associated protein [Cronobacter turicensis]
MTNLIIKHVIVHELLKESNKAFDHSKPYNLRDTELDKNNLIVKQLVKGVVDLYGSKGNAAHYGVFKNAQEAQCPVPSLFHQYYQVQDSVSDDFITLSKEIMKQMYDSAKEQIWASGGYVVFSDYVSFGLRYLLVTMIKKTNGVTISERLEPEEMIHLEMNNINQAAKINFCYYHQYQEADEVQRTELSYLSFISKTTGQSAAAYFIAALGCDKGIASAGATRKLPNEIRKFFRKNNETSPHAERIRNKIIKYLETQFESEQSAKLSDIEAVVTAELSFLAEDKREPQIRELMQHLNSEEIRIPTEFVINKTSLDKIRNVIFKTDQYSFNFDKDLLGVTADATIFYDNASGNLTFSNLPVEAKTKIRSALKEMNIKFDNEDARE